MTQPSNFDIEAFKKEAEALKLEGDKLNEILLNSPPDKNTPEWTSLVERVAALSLRQADIFGTVLEHFRKTFG